MKGTTCASGRTVLKLTATALIAGLGLAACSQTEAVYPEDKRYRGMNQGDYRMVKPGQSERERETIFGQGGLFGGGGDDKDQGGGTGIGVNAWLWRASLDTVAFMPLVSADPFGGVIITDWYADPATPGERFKANVFILGRELRADGVKVNVFRQVRDPMGNWTDAPVAPGVGGEMEDAVLTRARQLRIASNEG